MKIQNAGIKSSAAIDADKIADGSVSNAEFQRLNGVTSNIQDQLDDKQDTISGTAPIDVTGGVVSLNDTAVTPGSYTNADITIDAKGRITAAANGSGGGAVSSVNSQTGAVVLDSDDIAEGATNLYYTSARFDTDLATKTTDDVAEGATNKYFTNTAFNSAFSGKSTSDLTEGTNLYYTSARFNSALSTKSTSDLAEGSNLYFTDGRAKTAAVVNSLGGSETDQAPSVSSVNSALSGKQATGSYITALTGDATASGPGSASLTLANSGVTAGSYTNANITVDAKGRITVAANGSGGGGGTVTDVTASAPLSSTGGTTPDISISQSTTSTDGYLSSADWNTFNGKGQVNSISVSSANGFAGSSSGGSSPALTISTSVTGLLKGNGTAISAATSGTDYAPATSGTAIQKGNGSGGFSAAVANTDYLPATSGSAIQKADGSGGLTAATSGTDYAPATSGTSILKADGSGGFANAAAGTDYQVPITTGDASTSGATITLATVNGSPGSFGSASKTVSATVNAKGLITALSDQDIAIAQSQVTNLVSDLAGKQATGNYLTALTGDVSASGPGSASATLANTAVTPGSYTSANITVDAKGRITAAANGGGGGTVGSPTSYTQAVDAVTTAPTKGTTTIDQATYLKIGKLLHMNWNYKETVSGSAGSGIYLFTLPNSEVIDTAYLTCDPQFGSIVGTAHISNTTDNESASSSSANVYCYDTTHLAISIQNTSTTNFRFQSGGTFSFGNAPLDIQMNVNGLIVQ